MLQAVVPACVRQRVCECPLLLLGVVSVPLPYYLCLWCCLCETVSEFEP